MTDLHLAPLPAAQDADALDLLDLTFATDPSMGWYLLAGFDAHIDARCARIEFIAIAPDQQGRGLGSVLLSQCLVQLKAQGCRNVALETAVSRNLPFYRRHGLLQTGGLQIDGLYQHYLQSSGE